MIVADTDVLIDFLGGHEPSASRVAEELGRGTLKTTAVSVFELLVGARTERQQQGVYTLLAALESLPLDSSGADRAAQVRRQLDSEGRGIGMADSLIAGITLARGCSLLTRNRRPFERVSGLRLL